MELGDLNEELEGGLSFQGIHDLGDILRRCSKGGVVSGEELLRVAETLSAARRLRRLIEDPELRPVTTRLIVDLATLPELEKMLKFGLEEGGRIADCASEKLATYRRKLHAVRLERRALLQDLQMRFGSILQDTAIAERGGRPVLALKSGAIDQLQGIVHASSASGSTVFLEPQVVVPLGNRITAIESDVFQEEHRLLAAWSAAVGDNFESMMHLVKVVTQLDLALARARYGDWLGVVPPILQEASDAPFVFQELRHPLLVWQERRHQGVPVVPVTLQVDSHLRVVAITGPNTGGKTATLKSNWIGSSYG